MVRNWVGRWLWRGVLPFLMSTLCCQLLSLMLFLWQMYNPWLSLPTRALVFYHQHADCSFKQACWWSAEMALGQEDTTLRRVCDQTVGIPHQVKYFVNDYVNMIMCTQLSTMNATILWEYHIRWSHLALLSSFRISIWLYAPNFFNLVSNLKTLPKFGFSANLYGAAGRTS